MRQKITFADINKGKIKIIPAKDIAESRKRIREEMTPVVRDFNKKIAQFTRKILSSTHD